MVPAVRIELTASTESKWRSSTELRGHNGFKNQLQETLISLTMLIWCFLENAGEAGFEPAADAFKVSCTTSCATPQFYSYRNAIYWPHV